MAATTGSSGLPRPIRLIAALLLAGLPQHVCADDDLAVIAVRFWSLSDVTRIAIETSGPFTFRTDRLPNPERVFFDLKGARPELDGKGLYTVPVKDSRVKQVRVAETQPQVTRVVLDMEEGQFDISTSLLSVPDRLMIEVRRKGGDSSPAPLLSTSGVQKIPAPANAATAKVVLAETPPAKFPDPPVVPVRKAPAPARAAKLESRLPEPPMLSARLGPVKQPPATFNVWKIAPRPDDSLEEPVVVSPSPANAKPARRNSTGDRSLTRALGLKIRRVVLDPGHGGYDHGTTGPGGVLEKEIVLDVATRLGQLLEENLGSEVIFTRTTDHFVQLEDRPAFANAQKADLFLSIHANSSPIKTASGVETYYLSTTTSRAALDLAARENASSRQSISDLRDLLQKIVMRDKVDESREFASKVQDSLTRTVAAVNPPKPGARRDRGIKRAPFIVLIGAQMPSILTEIGFVSNSKEEGLLKRGDYRQKLAEAILNGVRQYAESLSQFEVAQTQKRNGSE